MRRRTKLLLLLAFVILVIPIGWTGYATIAWLGYGSAFKSPSADSLVDRHMPEFEVAEYHEAVIEAPPAIAWRAVERLDLERSPVIRAIFRAREILLRSTPTERLTTPMIDQLKAIGYTVLEEDPGREIVLGTVTQPWFADVVFRPIPRDDYAAFNKPDFVKIVVSFAVDSLGPREARFRSETRVKTTDGDARRKFRRYWAFLSPGIILIRHEALGVVKRDAMELTR